MDSIFSIVDRVLSDCADSTTAGGGVFLSKILCADKAVTPVKISAAPMIENERFEP